MLVTRTQKKKIRTRSDVERIFSEFKEVEIHPNPLVFIRNDAYSAPCKPNRRKSSSSSTIRILAIAFHPFAANRNPGGQAREGGSSLRLARKYVGSFGSVRDTDRRIHLRDSIKLRHYPKYHFSKHTLFREVKEYNITQLTCQVSKWSRALIHAIKPV